MPNFSDEFIKTKGRPFVYKGQQIYLKDEIKINPSEQEVKLIIESINSSKRQGVAIEASKGIIIYKNHELTKKGKRVVGIDFWADNGPEWELVFKNTDGILKVWNFWEHEYWTGQKVQMSFTNGAAIKIEELHNGRRYFCNDVEPDEDFDDLIFRIELLD